MDFAYPAPCEALRGGLGDLLAARALPERLRVAADAGRDPFDADLWQALTAHLAAPLADIDDHEARLAATVAAECAGAALAPVPLLGTLTAWAAGLQPFAAGRVALAPPLPAAGAALQFGGGGLHGQLPAVSDAAAAERLLIPVGDDMLVVGLRDAGVSLTVLPGLDLAHGVAALQFDGAAAERLPGAARRLLAIAATFAAFEQLGGAQRCLDLAVAYAGERIAFGQPIGAFQGVKHALARLHVEIELLRSNAWYAAWALAGDAPELPAAACQARLGGLACYPLAAQESLHLHGGVGFTWAHEVHLHLRRARALEAILGAAPPWRERLLAESAVLEGGPQAA